MEIYAWSLYGNLDGYGSSWTKGQYFNDAMSDDYVQDAYTQPTISIPSSNSVWSSSSSKSWSDDSSIEKVFENRDARLSLICDPEILCPLGFAYREGVNSTTGYYTDKFVDWNDYGTPTWSAPNNTTDGPIYTLSEVMLNYAEACAELEDLGKYTMTQTDLDNSVNIIRAKHANLPALTYAGKGKVSVNGTAITADPKNTTGISTLLWELRRERRSELMCDGFRYSDLMRWKLGSLLDFTKNPDRLGEAAQLWVVSFLLF